MLAQKILVIFTIFSSMALAAPAGESEDVSAHDISDLEKRSPTFFMYGGDGCTGQVHAYTHPDGTAFRCYPVPAAKRAIRFTGKYVAQCPHTQAQKSFVPFRLVISRIGEQWRTNK